ncbi:glycosyltransferase family 2 protein [Mesorhizobium sp. B4-1-4]|uniref:glycosyltransferase family 2 protein n=1 Tax=Mesorhizobium sp. B4-1-4 TaxID=2589888 RepID=UPI0011294E4E|nr:glycosyltransferase family 2 protein [Mesorhizobium sp. B4-1-4]UCI29356.1 glycosyltransferase family 2 protein [Mesorhizobium sp. B4-1-4]
MNPQPPEVSIILPTYNRADTIMRAVGSVLNQTFSDWELIVVDDGSTDATPRVDFTIDSRIRLIRQKNQGVAAARNTGLAAAKGRFIAFLDSDDEWLPHFLGLAISFLKAHPDEHYVIFEFLDDTDLKMVKDRIVHHHLSKARMIGSNALDLPPGETDDYMRVYQSRRELGPWATEHLPDRDASEARLYQGHIFHQTRWGYFAWLPATVLTRHALEVVGSFDTSRRSAEDYPFQALLCRHFQTNFISVPPARKHELGLDGRAPKEDHLATGPNFQAMRVNFLHYFDQLHWSANRGDRELSLLRRYYAYEIACASLRSGLRREAVSYFKQAACLHRRFWRAYVLGALAFFSFSDRAASASFGILQNIWRVW